MHRSVPAVIAVADKLSRSFEHVFATQDWHPPQHQSFASQHPGKKPGEVIDLHGLTQVLWPDHCVQGTRGAKLVGTFPWPSQTETIRKGQDPMVDSYSGFFDNGQRRATELESRLRAAKATEVFVMGLATDYCVKFTALDALRLGFHTTLVRDGCRGVDLRPGDSDRAIDEMKRAGVVITTSDELLRGLT